MKPAPASELPFYALDPTKVWPHAEFPLIPVGRMVMNRNPSNYFAEVEQMAFSVSHVIPGIEFSPDKILQGRIFSYPDTQRHRLGGNYLQIPVNCPFKVRTYQRDGPMCVTDNSADAPNYYPNSFGGPRDVPTYVEKSFEVSGEAQRFDDQDVDNFSQVGVFWRKVLTEAERVRLIENMSQNLKFAEDFIQQRAVENFEKCDADYGQRLRERLDTLNNELFMSTKFFAKESSQDDDNAL